LAYSNFVNGNLEGADHKSTKKTDNLTVFLALLGSDYSPKIIYKMKGQLIFQSEKL